MSISVYTPSSSSIVHATRVDFQKRTTESPIHIVQYDEAMPIILVELFSNGKKWVLPASVDAVKIRWGKIDRTYVRKDVLGCNEDRTAVYFEIDQQMTIFNGDAYPILEVDIGDTCAGSSPIHVHIDRNPVSRSDIESQVDDDLLDQLLEEVEQLQNTVDTLLPIAAAAIEDKRDAAIASINDKTLLSEAAIEAKTAECIASIPSDYTALEARVSRLEEKYSHYDFDIMMQAVRSGYGSNYPAGDQLLVDWNDNTNGNLYTDVPINIVDHEDAIINVNGNDETVHALTMEWHYTLPFGLSFDPAEALAKVGQNGLPAGSYYFKSNYNFHNMTSGSYYKFTLLNPLVSGNHLKTSDGGSGTTKMDVYADGQSFTKLYSVDVTLTDSSGDGAIYLGTMASTSDIGQSASYFDIDTDHNVYLNHGQRVAYGYNRWRDSLYRQYLNAEGLGWWTPQNIFDRAPSNIASLYGFLTGYSSYFKSAIRPVKIITYRNTTGDDGGTDITYDRIFLHSMANANVDGFSSQQNTGGLEGNYWEYYRNLASGQSNLNTNGTFKAYATYSILIKYALNAKTSAQYVFSRAALRGLAYNVLHRNTSGTLYYYYANNSFRGLPACKLT